MQMSWTFSRKKSLYWSNILVKQFSDAPYMINCLLRFPQFFPKSPFPFWEHHCAAVLASVLINSFTSAQNLMTLISWWNSGFYHQKIPAINFIVPTDHLSRWHLYVGSYNNCHRISLLSQVWFRGIINPTEQTDTCLTYCRRYTTSPKKQVSFPCVSTVHSPTTNNALFLKQDTLW